MRFTDRKLKSFKPRDKRYTVWEDNVHGGGTLGVRVTPKGTKSWVHMYDYQGKARMMTLGRYPAMSVGEAHEASGTAARIVKEGGDPARQSVEEHERRRQAPTVESLAELYIEMYAKQNKRSWQQDERMLAADVVPEIGHVRLVDLKRAHVVAVLDRVAGRGKLVQANRMRALMSKVFSFAVGRDLLEYNPVQGVPRRTKEMPKERYLTEAELRVFLGKLPELPMAAATRLALRFILLTGQRPGEVMGALWSEMDLEEAVWRLPGARAKNKVPHEVPLSPQAMAVLEEARELNMGSDAVFPSPRTGRVMRVAVLSTALRRARGHLGLAHFTAHDLRRTVTTGLARAGVVRLVAGKILNHKEAGVTTVYDRHGYGREKREALLEWAAVVSVAATTGSMMGDVTPAATTTPVAPPTHKGSGATLAE